MAKNIVIFSDGTGQAGGLKPDQNVSNIYKLYRACRSDPESDIDPATQIGFYDAGLGTEADESPEGTPPNGPTTRRPHSASGTAHAPGHAGRRCSGRPLRVIQGAAARRGRRLLPRVPALGPAAGQAVLPAPA